MWLICGLGNPDKVHKLTRHNLGFDVADSIVNFYEFNLLKKDKKKELYKGNIDKKKCLICKPLNYMNLSGPIINEIIKYYKIPKKKIIVIHDDLDLNISKVKTKTGGGNGGHNGLASIDDAIGVNYKRIRIGIGHPGSKEKVSKYVLEKFLSNERKILDLKINLITKYFSLVFDNDNLFFTKITS